MPLDVWSAGCVLAELLLGQPIFPGDSGVDQLVEIIKVLGTPTREQIREMNPNYTEFKFPQIKSHPWQKVRIEWSFLVTKKNSVISYSVFFKSSKIFNTKFLPKIFVITEKNSFQNDHVHFSLCVCLHVTDISSFLTLDNVLHHNRILHK